MENKTQTKEVLAVKKLSTPLSEWEEHKISERHGNANVFKTHHIGAGTEMLPGKQHQDSQSNTTGRFPAALLTGYGECSADSPLKGTPWEDAAISSVARKKHRRRTCKRRVKEQEHIEFWLNFFD